MRRRLRERFDMRQWVTDKMWESDNEREREREREWQRKMLDFWLLICFLGGIISCYFSAFCVNIHLRLRYSIVLCIFDFWSFILFLLSFHFGFSNFCIFIHFSLFLYSFILQGQSMESPLLNLCLTNHHEEKRRDWERKRGMDLLMWTKYERKYDEEEEQSNPLWCLWWDISKL